MDWTCTLTEERLVDILDGSLAADQSAAFLAHTRGCEPCVYLVAQVGGLVKQIRQIPAIDEPPFLASRIIAATRGTPPERHRSQGWLAWLPAPRSTRLALGALTVAASFLIVLHAVNSVPRRIDLNPADLFRSANRHVHLTYAHGVKFVNDLRVVYVIESRLSSQAQPASEPRIAPSTEPAPRHQPPDSQARPKPRPAPYIGRGAGQSAPAFAMLFARNDAASHFDQTPRSLP